MKKVDLNKERCIGCGACMSVAPENFTFDDDGRAKLINTEINDAAIEASEVCPVSAITIENKCTCENNCNCTEENNCGCLESSKCEDGCNCNEDCNCGCNK